MACKFYDSITKDSKFLVNLSSWNIFQEDSISEKMFKDIKSTLEKDFVIDNNENLIEAIREYIKLFSNDLELNQSLNKSLDKLLGININENFNENDNQNEILIPNKDPLVSSLTSSDNIFQNESASEEDINLAKEEYAKQLMSSSKPVTFLESIKTSKDLITKFQNNNSLYNRFVNEFKRSIFKNSFLNFDKKEIVRNIEDLNNNISNYKQELINNITKFLGIKDIELYLDNGEFNIEGYNNVINSLIEYYKNNDPSDKLNSINNLIYTKLSKINQNFLNAYNSYIILENFDNLINLLTNGLITVDPYRLGIKNINKNILKYVPKFKNALTQHFTLKESFNIIDETTQITKSIIENIPLLDTQGKWDGVSYLTVNEFNNAISRLEDPEIKASNKYPSLKLAKTNPTVAYIEFFEGLFATDGILNKTKLNKFTKNQDFHPSIQKSLISIYNYIFNRDPESNSLYNIVRLNQDRLSFNYFLDILSYMNKQNKSEYISYKYDPDSKEYEINTFSNLNYESYLFRYERNLSEHIDNIAKNGDSTNTILNILRNKFNIKVYDNYITLTLGTKTINISNDLNSENIDINGLDLNKALLDSIIIPNPEQVNKIINGESLSENLMNGYKLLELLQLVTDFPFINSSGQLYILLKNQYRSESESVLKGDLLGFLYNTLKYINILDSIYNTYTSKGIIHNDISPEKFKSLVKKSAPEFKSMSSIKFDKFFINGKLNPRLKVNLSKNGDRSNIFKFIIESINLLNRESNPSTYKNSSGDNVPSIELMNLVKNIHEFIYTTKEYQSKLRKNTPYKNIFQGNIFYNSPELLKGISLKSEFVTQKGTIVSKADFNISEYGVSSIILDYYKNLIDDRIDYIEILPTVYSDKSNQSLIKVSKNLRINGKKLKDASISDLKLELFNSQRKYYINILSNIFTLYKRIGDKLGINYLIEGIDNSTKFDKIKDNFDKINNLLLTKWNDVQNAANELSLSDPNFKFITEVHYSQVELEKGVKVYRLNPFIENMCNIYKITSNSDKYYNDFINRSLEKFIIDIRENININSDYFKFLQKENKLKDWIDKDNSLIIVKNEELNPLFEKFFYIDSYISTQFLQISVGEPYAHPSKLKNVYYYTPSGDVNQQYFIRDHANRLSAQYKRMVAMQSTMHNYYQGSLNGTASDINLAIIQDEKAPVFNPSGESDKIDALDGSMECTPFQNILENNSMFSSSAGNNRKNFGYNIDPLYGSGLLMKCATFSITNYRMRKSPEKVHLLQKMTDKAWTIPNLNLMQDFNGNKRNLYDVVENDLYYYNINDGKYYKIINLENVGRNLYKVTEKEVDINGNEIRPYEVLERNEIIDTNFKLWKVLGGQYSYSLNTSNPINPILDNSGDYGEASNYAVVDFINSTGFYKTQYDLDLIRGLLGNENVNFNSNIFDLNYLELPKDRSGIIDENGNLKVLLDQNYVYQPLKHSDIHYIANTSSVKVGGYNINPSSSRYDNSELKYSKVGTQFIGIQMDADHLADSSEVSEPTQVISLLATNGYTMDLAEEAYKALGIVVDSTLRKFFKAQNQIENLNNYDQLKENNKDELYKILTQSILTAFENSNNTDSTITGYLNEVAKEFTRNLNSRLFNSKNLNFKVPFSANSINSVFITMLASKMNSNSIKRTFSGMGAIMIPSYGSSKRYYFDGTEKLIDPSTNNYLKGYYSQYDLEKIANKAGFVSTIDINGNTALINYLNTGNLIQDISPELINFGDIIYNPETGENIEIDTYDKYKYYRNYNGLLKINKGIRKNLQPLNITFNIPGINKLYTLYDHPLIEDIFKLRESNASKEEILIKQHQINKYIGLLQDGYLILDTRMPEYNLLKESGKVFNYKEYEVVNISNLNIKRAQAVISKVYKSIFGLKAGDCISDIINQGPSFFRNRLLGTYTHAKSETLPYDLILLRNNSINTNVIINNNKNSDYIKSLIPAEIPTEIVNGRRYRLDNDGNQMYDITGIDFYYDTSNNIIKEVIVINPDNIKQLRNIFKYNNEYIGEYIKFDKDNIKYINKYINKESNLYKLLNLDEISELDLNDPKYDIIIDNLNSSYNNYLNDELDAKSNDIYISFKESLNITVNRIPAQAYQSIMAMEVIDFSDSDANEIEVSKTQTWLQGSDYDIDKAYIMIPLINKNGIYQKWSNAFDFSSDEAFELSKKLPFPTEEKIRLEKNNNNDYNELDNIIAYNILNNIHPLDIVLRILNDNVDLTYNPDFILNNIKESINDINDFDYINLIENYINRIQYYLDQHSIKLDDFELLNASKNFLFNKIYQISDNLKNTIASLSPVSMGDPQEAAAKSEGGKYAEDITDINPSVKWRLFFENMAGKKVIGISAVGQKIFLAATQYFNTEIRKGSTNIDNFIKSNLYFNKIFEILKSNRKDSNESDIIKLFTNTITNLNLDDYEYIYDVFKEARDKTIDIKDAIDLTQNRYQEDKSLVISALISAATDNAKELILSKINAGPDLAGVYVYLIINGLSFKDIATLMTSNEVNSVINASRVNRMYDDFSTIDSTLKKIKNLVNINSYIDQNYILSVRNYIYNLYKKATIKNSDLKSLTLEDIRNIILDLENTSYTFTKLAFNEDFDDFYDDVNDDINELSIIKSSNEVISKLIKYFKELEKFKYLHDNLIDNINFITFDKAYNEAKELTALGQILGINGGIKTKQYDRYNYSKLFDTLIQDGLKRLDLQSDNIDEFIDKYKSKNPNIYTDEELYDIVNNAINNLSDSGFSKIKFNLDKFLNNLEYRDSVIKFYNLIKSTINVFDLITKLPHYNAFIKSYNINEKNSKLSSIKYLLQNQIINRLEIMITSKVVGNNLNMIGKLSEQQLNVIRDYIDELIIKKYLYHKNLSINILKGQNYFKDGKITTASENTQFSLSNDDGLASFKLYMENYVIPILKNGYTVNSKGILIFGKELVNNNFLNNLIITDKPSPLTGEIYTYYRPSLNMMNTKDNPEFDKISSAFSSIENVEFRGIKLSDLFFIYNLIINKGRRGQDSLTKILQSSVFNPNSLQTDYLRYIGELDYNSSELGITYGLNEENLNINDVNFDNLQMRLAPISGSYESIISRNKYNKKYDSDKGKYIIQEVDYSRKNRKYKNIELKEDGKYYILQSKLNYTSKSEIQQSTKALDTLELISSLIRSNKIKLTLNC